MFLKMNVIIISLWLIYDASMTHGISHEKVLSYFKYAVLFQKYIIENSRSLSNTVSYRYLSSMDMIRIIFRNLFSNLIPLYFRVWIFEYLETVIFSKIVFFANRIAVNEKWPRLKPYWTAMNQLAINHLPRC